MAAITKIPFKTRDGDISFCPVYSSKDVWLDLEQISKLFSKEKREINKQIKIFIDKKPKNRKKLSFTNESGKKITKYYYNFNVVKFLNKKIKCKYYKEYKIWVRNFCFRAIIMEIKFWKLFLVIKIPAIVYNIIFITISFILCLIYYFNTKDTQNLQDLSISLLGISIAIIALTIPSIINIVKENNQEMKKSLKSKDKIDILMGKSLHSASNTIINELTQSVIIVVSSAILILIFNISQLWKNILSIFALTLILLSLLHTILWISSKQKYDMNNIKKLDTLYTDEKLEDELTGWKK